MPGLPENPPEPELARPPDAVVAELAAAVGAAMGQAAVAIVVQRSEQVLQTEMAVPVVVTLSAQLTVKETKLVVPWPPEANRLTLASVELAVWGLSTSGRQRTPSVPLENASHGSSCGI